VLGVLAAGAGCDAGADDSPASGPRPSATPSPTTSPATSPATSPGRSPSDATAPPTEPSSPLCREGPGRTVSMLPDVTVAAVDVPPVTDGSGQVLVEGFSVPAQRVEAGCVIRYDAPGGCLGAVRISEATIPGVTIPESVVPETDAPGGGTVPEKEFPQVSAAPVTRAGAYAPRVCQVRRDGRLLTVSRVGVVREGFSRNGLSRPGGVRPRECGDDGCAPEVRVPSVQVPPVRLPAVDVDPARLASRKLPGHRDLDVVTGQGRTAYVAPARVLFDTDKAAIRPAAYGALRAIAARITATAPGSRLLVEGHTDDRGSARHGLVLSRQRARAVADWLVEHGFERSRIRTRGFGETAPAVPNTSATNRQKNRRVVISVLARPGH
jgi:outer membrane protein OmpA-like peptidoglycan-associated protein